MRIILLIFFLTSFTNLNAQKYTEQYIQEANVIGLNWWEDFNNKNYIDSYNSLDISLKDRFSIDSWENQVKRLMNEIGFLQKRSIINTYFQSEIDGLEDGFYVFIEYQVSYSNTKNHLEHLILKQNDKFEWKIISFEWEFQKLK
tara:strand:+ start:947 stop:1378 length:432 start_codon:yes stop_codon:yes gene_type:complete